MPNGKATSKLGSSLRLGAVAIALSCSLGAIAAMASTDPTPWLVTSARDSGEGSLRAVLAAATRDDGPHEIRFDPQVFAKPVTIELERPLPLLTGEILLDGYIPGRLWAASGVTVSGRGARRVLEVAEGASVEVRHLTLADGSGDVGGALSSRGRLVLRSSTVVASRASEAGGGVAVVDGTAWIVNSTLSGNEAALGGGGLATLGGTTHVVHATLAGNRAPPRRRGLRRGADFHRELHPRRFVARRGLPA